ncbi:MAG: precorrin-2 C(20)-methyltransferase [Nitrospirota bacterium]
MAGKLYGIGVGPGDPGLITLKAVSIIKAVPVVIAPKSALESESLALAVVREHIDLSRQKVITPLFPMSMKKDVLESAWAEAAKAASDELLTGKDVAFLTIGDPSLFSTYSYILEKIKKLVPDLQSETVPGVSSINLAAARAGLDLALGQERLAVMPMGKDLEQIKKTIAEFDTVVLMKVNRNFGDLKGMLSKAGLSEKSLYIRRAGTDRELVVRGLENVRDEDVDYFSLVIIKKYV